MNQGIVPLLTKHIGTKFGRIRDFILHKLVPEHWGKLTLATLAILLGSKITYDVVQAYRHAAAGEIESDATNDSAFKKWYKLAIVAPLLALCIGGSHSGIIVNAETGESGCHVIERTFVRQENEGGKHFVRRAHADDEDTTNTYKTRSLPGLQQPCAALCGYYALYHLIALYNHHYHGTPLQELINRVAFNQRLAFWKVAIILKRLNNLYVKVDEHPRGYYTWEDSDVSDHILNAWLYDHKEYIKNTSIKKIEKAWCSHMQRHPRLFNKTSQETLSRSNRLAGYEVTWLIKNHAPELSENGHIKENIIVVSIQRLPPYNLRHYTCYISFGHPDRTSHAGRAALAESIQRYRRSEMPLFFIVNTGDDMHKIKFRDVTFDWPAHEGASLRRHFFAMMMEREGETPIASSIDSYKEHDNGLSRVTHAIENYCENEQLG